MISKFSAGFLVAAAFAWIDIAAAISLPNCQTIAPPQKNITTVRTTNVSVPAHPFGIVYAQQQKDTAFVALNTTLGVLDTSALIPKLIHQIPLPAPYVSINGATGITLTHNGRYILVTTFSTSLLIIDAAAAATGNPDAVVGVLIGSPAAGSSAIEVHTTLDDDHAFVSQEDGSLQIGRRGTIEVFKLQYPSSSPPTKNHTVTCNSIGYIPLGGLVVGTTLSPDGRYLYATSEIASNTTTEGTLSVLDVETLTTNPPDALIATANAGCSPVRVIVSSDGSTVWVTARESNHLLAFSAEKLVAERTSGSNALLASVQVGTSPVGLTFTDASEKQILVANSNRFAGEEGFGNATSGLSIVDVDAALRGEAGAVLGEVRSGMFPREVARAPEGGTVLVSVYGSEVVQGVDVGNL
ncbi:hypothetical protein ACLMJK_002874 [Lecanora helva]